jgi:hypothetical protein
VLIMSRSWKRRDHELSYVARSVAGAASRSAAVTILTPGGPAVPEADGAFDVIGIGIGAGDDWPSPEAAIWPHGLADDATIILDELTTSSLLLLQALGPSRRRWAISSSTEDPSTSILSPVGSTGPEGAIVIGLHVPVNPLAATHRHNGFGFVGYVLVLSDRPVAADQPPAGAAWLTAGLPHADVVVVEQATASVWRGRARRGAVSVDTRTDLWRLMAHARVCVDLGPGPIVARECVESLRFGTPILVPEAAAAAATHARAGGGLTFGDTAGLLAGTRAFFNEDFRTATARSGRAYADERYGDPRAFATALERALAGPDRG